MKVFASLARGGIVHVLNLTFEGEGHEKMAGRRVSRPTLAGNILTVKFIPHGDLIFRREPDAGASGDPYCHKGWGVETARYGRIKGIEFFPAFKKTEVPFEMDEHELIMELPKELQLDEPWRPGQDPDKPGPARELVERLEGDELLRFCKSNINIALRQDPTLEVSIRLGDRGEANQILLERTSKEEL